MKRKPSQLNRKYRNPKEVQEFLALSTPYYEGYVKWLTRGGLTHQADEIVNEAFIAFWKAYEPHRVRHRGYSGRKIDLIITEDIIPTVIAWYKRETRENHGNTLFVSYDQLPEDLPSNFSVEETDRLLDRNKILYEVVYNFTSKSRFGKQIVLLYSTLPKHIQGGMRLNDRINNTLGTTYSRMGLYKIYQDTLAEIRSFLEGKGLLAQGCSSNN